MHNRDRVRRAKGFSMVELLIVVAIISCVTVVALPSTLHIVAYYRARGTMNGLSGALQNCRGMAISKNTPMTVHFGNTSQGSPMAWVQDATETASLAKGHSQFVLGRGVVRFTTPTGTGAPPVLTGTSLWGGLPDPQTTEVSFNSRGLPCAYDSAHKTCASGAFVYYFTYEPPLGANGWAAISVSPAGRIKPWFWSGTAWTN